MPSIIIALQIVEGLPKIALLQIHIFCLSHVLRRPIIVYGVKYVKSWKGENLGFARFEGEHDRSAARQFRDIDFYVEAKDITYLRSWLECMYDLSMLCRR